MRGLAVLCVALLAACASASNTPGDEAPIGGGGDAGSGGGSAAGAAGKGGSGAGKAGTGGTAGNAGAGGGAGAAGKGAGAAGKGGGTAGTGGGAGKAGTGGGAGKAGTGGGAGKAGTGGGATGGASGKAGSSQGGSSGAGQAGTGSGGAGQSGAAGQGGSTSGSGGSGGVACGNGTTDAGEDCDDANVKGGDGCSSTCKWETSCDDKNGRPTIACGETKSDSIEGNYGDIDDVCGQSFAYQDQIFVFEAKNSERVTVTYTAMPDQKDMGLFVLAGACHGSLCIADAGTEGDRHDVSFDAVAGTTYYLVLEAPSFQPDYTLKVSCP